MDHVRNMMNLACYPLEQVVVLDGIFPDTGQLDSEQVDIL